MKYTKAMQTSKNCQEVFLPNLIFTDSSPVNKKPYLIVI